MIWETGRARPQYQGHRCALGDIAVPRMTAGRVPRYSLSAAEVHSFGQGPQQGETLHLRARDPLQADKELGVGRMGILVLILNLYIIL